MPTLPLPLIVSLNLAVLLVQSTLQGATPCLINGYRIDHACGLLAKGETLTEAMLASGFNTKSNFNRKFLWAKGCAPSDWKVQSA